jgi:peptide/nickel transport system permease protein
MLAFVLRRSAAGLLIAFVVSMAVYAIAPLAAGGDPAVTVLGGNEGLQLSEQQIEESRHRLGLDRPFLVRYGDWLLGTLHGDLGKSLFRDQSVAETISDALPVTASIAVLSVVWILLIAIPLGIFAAVKPQTLIGRVVIGVTSIGIATPHFVAGLFLVRIVSLQIGILPAVGYRALADDPSAWFKSILLPSAALAIPAAAALIRFVRTSMLEVLRRDYIRTARGKGLPPWKVVWKHSLKNALIPAVTVIGLEIRILLGGSVAVEAVFALPGMGTLAVNAILQGDYPILLGTVIVTVLIVVVVNMLVDVSYAFLNPRIRAL